MPENKSRLVYSTDQSIPMDRRPAEPSLVTRKPALGQNIRVRLDRKKRGGKSVTLIEGMTLSASDMEALLRQLKTTLGTGGTMNDATLEIQGDHCGTVITFLENKGYKPKRSGG
jgi:translation initiation factor 1